VHGYCRHADFLIIIIDVAGQIRYSIFKDQLQGMNLMKPNLLLVAAISALSLMPSSAHAVTYINETFEDDTIGVAPTDPAQKLVNQVTVAAGTGVIGTDNVAHFNDTTTANGNLEYNVGTSNTIGSLYVQFDLLNNAPGNTGSAANPVIFGLGPWSASSGIQLGANASRALGVEFYQTGSSSTLKVRSNSTALVTATYDMSLLQTVKIWVNDNDSTTLDYTRPDNLTTATLGANSFVIWVNDALVGTETVGGLGMNVAGVGSTVGNTTLGRVGFDSTTTTLADFSIDNLLVKDIAAIPEPSSAALLLSGVILLGWFSRRWLLSR
jgi:hypothetical protein